MGSVLGRQTRRKYILASLGISRCSQVARVTIIHFLYKFDDLIGFTVVIYTYFFCIKAFSQPLNTNRYMPATYSVRCSSHTIRSLLNAVLNAVLVYTERYLLKSACCPRGRISICDPSFCLRLYVIAIVEVQSSKGRNKRT